MSMVLFADALCLFIVSVHSTFNNDITMPPLVCKWGHLKGHVVPVVGLSALKIKTGVSGDKSVNTKKKLLPLTLQTSLKEKGILLYWYYTYTKYFAFVCIWMRTPICPNTALLKWFVDSEVAKAVLKKATMLIDKDWVELCPEHLCDAVL